VEQDLPVRKSTTGSQGFAPKPVKNLLHGFTRLLGSEQGCARVVSDLLVKGEGLGGEEILHPLLERAVAAGHRGFDHLSYLWGYAIRPDIRNCRVQVSVLG
jgi:hypothetical protein